MKLRERMECPVPLYGFSAQLLIPKDLKVYEAEKIAAVLRCIAEGVDGWKYDRKRKAVRKS